MGTEAMMRDEARAEFDRALAEGPAPNSPTAGRDALSRGSWDDLWYRVNAGRRPRARRAPAEQLDLFEENVRQGTLPE